MKPNADDVREGISTLLEAYKPRFITLAAVEKDLGIQIMYHFSVGVY